MDGSLSNIKSRILLCICVVDEHSSIKSVHLDNIESWNNTDQNLDGKLTDCAGIDDNIIGMFQRLLESNTSFREEFSDKLHKLCDPVSVTVYNYHLTSREKDVLKLLIEGLTKKEISNRLFVSYNTIGTHVNHIYQKLNVNNRGSAVAKTLTEALLQ
jgi:DNA-binding CsgD family transcriptional regulator